MRPLDRADLVVGFERDHVRAAVVEAAAKRERSFTFRELVRLLEDVPEPKISSGVARAQALVAAAAARRGSLSPPGSDSIADPFGRSWRVYRETAEETRQLCSRLAERLFAVHRGDFQPLPAKLPRRRIGWRR
jgi:protein-tyrosine-phosphatase